MSACNRSSHGWVAAAIPAAIWVPRPRGAVSSRAPDAMAIAVVASVLPPSTMMISGTSPSAARVAGRNAAAFRVGIMIERSVITAVLFGALGFFGVLGVQGRVFCLLFARSTGERPDSRADYHKTRMRAIVPTGFIRRRERIGRDVTRGRGARLNFPSVSTDGGSSVGVTCFCAANGPWISTKKCIACKGADV